MALKTKDFGFQIKEISKSGEFSGYGSLFGIKDSYKDIVMPGAFKKSLKKSRPKLLWQHRSDEIIGLWTEAKEDEKGLYLEGRLLLELPAAQKAHVLLKEKALDGLSIGYRTIRDDYDRDTHIRKLLELDLWEVSLVTFPALKPAKVGRVKSSGGTVSNELNMLAAQLNIRRAQAAMLKMK